LLGPARRRVPRPTRLWVGGYPLLAIGLIRLVRLRARPASCAKACWTRLGDGHRDGPGCAGSFLILPAAEHEKLSLATVCGAFYPARRTWWLFAAARDPAAGPRLESAGPTRYLAAALTLTLVGDVLISMLPTLFPGSVPRRSGPNRLDGGSPGRETASFIAALVHPPGRPGSPSRTTSAEQRPATLPG